MERREGRLGRRSSPQGMRRKRGRGEMAGLQPGLQHKPRRACKPRECVQQRVAARMRLPGPAFDNPQALMLYGGRIRLFPHSLPCPSALCLFTPVPTAMAASPLCSNLCTALHPLHQHCVRIAPAHCRTMILCRVWRAVFPFGHTCNVVDATQTQAQPQALRLEVKRVTTWRMACSACSNLERIKKAGGVWSSKTSGAVSCTHTRRMP